MNGLPIHLQTLITSVQPASSGAPESAPLTGDLFSRITSGSPFRSSKPDPPDPSRTIRCARALGKDIYVGCADGTLIRCTLRSDGPSTGDAYTVSSRQVLPTKRPIDSIALVPSVSKALILSGGTIFYLTLPSLDPIPSTVIQPTRGVIAFALDDSDGRRNHHISPPSQANPSSNNLGNSAGAGAMQGPPEWVSFCVMREKQITLYNLAQRLQRVRDIPLPQPQRAILRSGQYLCVADAEYYSVIDLEATTFTPVAPLLENKPLIAVVGAGEFLIGNPAGDAMAGIFLNGMAEPTRPPIEWPLHPLSISIDHPYISALLPDGTIQIHSVPSDMADLPLHLHTIPAQPSLPLALRPTFISFNPGAFFVRSSLRARRVRRMRFTLLPPANLPQESEPEADSRPPPPPSKGPQTPEPDPDAQVPRTPPRARTARRRRPLSSSKTTNIPDPNDPPSFAESRTLLVGADGIQAYVHPTLLSRAEVLLDGGKIDDCARLVEGAVRSARAEGAGGLDWGSELGIDIRYIYARLAFKCVHETLFEDAGDHLFQARLDPRLLIRLFPDLRGGLISDSDTVNIFAGLEEVLTSAETIRDIIRNYSPIRPSVDSAPSTVELAAVLEDSARVMLMRYLSKVRDAQRGVHLPPGSEAEHIRRVVETVYLKLLIQTGSREEVQEMLRSENVLDNTVLEEIVPALSAYEFFDVLIELYRRRNDERRLLEIWCRIVEEMLMGTNVENPIGEIIQLLSSSKDHNLVREYGLWLARHEPVAAFSLFASARSSKGTTPSVDDQEILRVFRVSSSIVAEQYLEFLVLNKNINDRGLHEELVTKYLDSVLVALGEGDVAKQYLSLATAYATAAARGPFLTYFASNASRSQASQARIKAALFLQGSTLYDVQAAQKRIEPCRHVLVFERAIMDGKLGNDRSALTLLAQLGDFSSAEAYCTLGGEVIPGKVALQVGELSQVQPWARLVAAPRPARREDRPLQKTGNIVDEKRVKHLLKILMEVYTHGGRETPSRETADLLNSQAINLDVLDVLSSVPPSWSLNTISLFLTRSFRRQQHEAHEGMIIKGIGWGQNLQVVDRAFTVVRAQGGVVEEPATQGQETTSGGPTSFAEKEKLPVIVIPGPEPVVGSVTSVDLRARKEGFVENELHSTGSGENLA